MTRSYKVTPVGSAAASPGPRPPSMQPRAGVQVVQRREPRVGPSAAELDGVTMPEPIRLADEVDPPLVHGNGVSLAPGSVNYVPGTAPRFPRDACVMCERVESECTITVHGPSGAIICDQCVERAIDQVRQEMPKARLRLAMERMLAGQVTQEMVQAVEKLTNG